MRMKTRICEMEWTWGLGHRCGEVDESEEESEMMISYVVRTETENGPNVVNGEHEFFRSTKGTKQVLRLKKRLTAGPRSMNKH